jgi:hypothetical protein
MATRIAVVHDDRWFRALLATALRAFVLSRSRGRSRASGWSSRRSRKPTALRDGAHLSPNRSPL